MSYGEVSRKAAELQASDTEGRISFPDLMLYPARA